MNAQRGQTLVELIVGLAVTALLMGVLGGVLFAASDRTSQWSHRVYTAGNGAALASYLQQDSHRYCPEFVSSAQLNFERPLTDEQVVTYWINGTVVLRQSTPVARGNGMAFSLSSQAISVKGILSSGPLVVFVRPPGQCT